MTGLDALPCHSYVYPSELYMGRVDCARNGGAPSSQNVDVLPQCTWSPNAGVRPLVKVGYVPNRCAPLMYYTGPIFRPRPAYSLSLVSRSSRSTPPAESSAIATTSAQLSLQGKMLEWCSKGPMNTIGLRCTDKSCMGGVMSLEHASRTGGISKVVGMRCEVFFSRQGQHRGM